MAADEAAAAAIAATEALDISDGSSAPSMLDQLKSSGNMVVSTLGEEAEKQASQTVASQELKGSNSYYYWHSDSERRRQAGEQPVPVPLPKKLASSEVVHQKPMRSIDKFSFIDDGPEVKVYINLDGPLIDACKDDVEADFDERSLIVTVNTPAAIYKFHVDRLNHSVDPARCKAVVTKGRKLLIKLYKVNRIENWAKLRAMA